MLWDVHLPTVGSTTSSSLQAPTW